MLVNQLLKTKTMQVSVFVFEKSMHLDKNWTPVFVQKSSEQKLYIPKYRAALLPFILTFRINSKKWNGLFRNRFRMPYKSYYQLVEQCTNDERYFTQWKRGRHKYNHQESHPISLLVLTSLRYLGRGWTLDDLQESTAISKETIRAFLLQFIEFCSTVLYNEHVGSLDTSENSRRGSLDMYVETPYII